MGDLYHINADRNLFQNVSATGELEQPPILVMMKPGSCRLAEVVFTKKWIPKLLNLH